MQAVTTNIAGAPTSRNKKQDEGQKQQTGEVGSTEARLQSRMFPNHKDTTCLMYTFRNQGVQKAFITTTTSTAAARTTPRRASGLRQRRLADRLQITTKRPMVVVGAKHIGNTIPTQHCCCMQSTTRAEECVHHPKFNPRSSQSIARSPSISSSCYSDFEQAWQARRRTQNRWSVQGRMALEAWGATEKKMDEVCGSPAQARPMWPPSWHHHEGPPSPSYPVGRSRVGLLPCRPRSVTPWCGRALRVLVCASGGL